MRRILLALLVFGCAMPSAEAARRDDTNRTASRSAQQQPSTQRPPQLALRPGDVRTSRSGIAARGATAAAVPRNAATSCTRRNGRTVCAAAPARSSIAGWQNGLPTADYAQRECPNGTFATLARGHEDVVRCMPL